MVACNKLLVPIDRMFLKAVTPSSFRPIFIVGAPRTGSTILYQILTHQFDIGYISNFECIFSQTTELGCRIHKYIYKNQRHASFSAVHGATDGLNSPSECGNFWYRWFPRNKHYVCSEEIDSSSKKNMQLAVHGIMNMKQKPLLFKNLNCGQRIRVLREVFPEALFIYCKRNPVYVAQSILRVKERLFADASKWWSIMPKEYDQIKLFKSEHQVVAQVYFIEKEIENALDTHPSAQFIVVKYEDFCSNICGLIRNISSFFIQNKLVVTQMPQSLPGIIYNGNVDRLPPDSMKKIKYYVEKYYEILS